MWLGLRGIRCVILALIPQMAINKSSHRPLCAASYVCSTVRKGTAGIIGLCILRNKTFEHFKQIQSGGENCQKKRNCNISKSKKVRFGSDNWCKSKEINTPEGVALYAQPYGPHGAEQSNIRDHPPKRINFKNNLHFSISVVYWQSNFNSSNFFLACVLWSLVSDLVGS